jgi:hypothetical protein
VIRLFPDEYIMHQSLRGRGLDWMVQVCMCTEVGQIVDFLICFIAVWPLAVQI